MWFCSQIGAREHYAVARALHQQQRLAVLYTDFWAGPTTRTIATWQNGKPRTESRNGFVGGALRSLGSRFHPELENAETVSWNFRSLYWEAVLRKRKSETGDQRVNTYGGFIEVGRRYALRVSEALVERADLNSNSILFAYDTGALETLQCCKAQGLKTVLGQMDPNRVEVKMVQAEEKLWPGWALQPLQVPEAYFQRREQEWALADRIVVNSKFSRQALLQQNVPAHKLVVIPLCYEAEDAQQKVESRNEKFGSAIGKTGDEFQLSAFSPKLSTLNPQPSTSPLRVLFLGQVILRKGIQYLMQAARELEQESIHFDVVGPIGIAPDKIATAPRNLTFHGRATRDQAAYWYRQADVFVLPTLSDGFALTQLEAMAHGLPVVTTPNCGDVVTDGVDGFIVPTRDPAAVVRIFQRYLAEPELLQRQKAAALEKSNQFTLVRLTENLLKLELSLTSDLRPPISEFEPQLSAMPISTR
jgi:glycosyltransferase involved in cell wall biosynthesis